MPENFLSRQPFTVEFLRTFYILFGRLKILFELKHISIIFHEIGNSAHNFISRMGCASSRDKFTAGENTLAYDDLEVEDPQEGEVVSELDSLRSTRERDPEHVFTIKISTRPLGIILTSGHDGTCAYVTTTNG